MNFLNNKYARVLTVLLLLQGVVFYSVALRAENIPPVGPMSAFPTNVGGWKTDGFIDVLAGGAFPNQANIVPGGGNSLGFEDMKLIEALEFLRSVEAGRQHQPGFSEALANASVAAASFCRKSWSAAGRNSSRSVSRTMKRALARSSIGLPSDVLPWPCTWNVY